MVVSAKKGPAVPASLRTHFDNIKSWPSLVAGDWAGLFRRINRYLRSANTKTNACAEPAKVSMHRTKQEVADESIANIFRQGAFGGPCVLFEDVKGTIRVQKHDRAHLNRPVLKRSAMSVYYELEADRMIRVNGKMNADQVSFWRKERIKRKETIEELNA